MDRQEPVEPDESNSLETIGTTQTITSSTTELISPSYRSIVSKIKPAEMTIILGILLISILALVLRLEWSKEITIAVVSGLLGFLRTTGDSEHTK